MIYNFKIGKGGGVSKQYRGIFIELVGYEHSANYAKAYIAYTQKKLLDSWNIATWRFGCFLSSRLISVVAGVDVDKFCLKRVSEGVRGEPDILQSSVVVDATEIELEFLCFFSILVIPTVSDTWVTVDAIKKNKLLQFYEMLLFWFSVQLGFYSCMHCNIDTL